MDYLLYVVTIGLINMGLVFSLDLVIGRTGLFSMSQAGFFGIGAYTTALLTTDAGWPFLPSALVAALLTAVATLLVSVPSLRVRDDYLVVTTLGLQLILVEVANNLQVTGANNGISNIPAAFGLQSRWTELVLVVVVVAFVGLLYALVVDSPLGRTLNLVRTDEYAAAALGRSVRSVKVLVFAISGGMAGLLGAVYASYLNYVNPQYFEITLVITLLTMLIVGGVSRFAGVVIGTVVMTAVPELFRQIGSGPTLSAVVQILFGVTLIVVLLLRPAGLASLLPGRSRRAFAETVDVAVSPDTASEKVGP